MALLYLYANSSAYTRGKSESGVEHDFIYSFNQKVWGLQPRYEFENKISISAIIGVAYERRYRYTKRSLFDIFKERYRGHLGDTPYFRIAINRRLF